MAYNQSYGYGGPTANQQGIRAYGGYGSQQTSSNASPAPPAPYSNPVYPANSHYPNPPPSQPTLQTTNHNAYQFQVPPPAPPPSQPQHGPSYMNYNPGAYGAMPGSPAGQAHPPSLPPRTQNQGTLSASHRPQTTATSLAHKPSVSGKNRYNFTPSAPSYQQNNAPLVWNQAAGRYEYAQSTGNQQHSAAAGLYTPPTLPPRPGSSHAPPPPPMSPQQQAFLQNQAYLQQPSPEPTPPPVHGASQTAGSAPPSTGYQQNNQPTQTFQRPSSASPKPPNASRPYSQPPQQGPQSPSSRPPQTQQQWFNPSGSRFPLYQPPNQPHQAAPQQPRSPPPPPKPPRPSASPGAANNRVPSPPSMPPNQDAPVSPMEHRDSSASLYDPPPLKGQGHHSHVVSRENSETSVFASGALPRPPIGQNRQQQPTPKATSVMQPSNRQGSGNKFSVLGSGAGPSDWAHFDTASADSIDDTELYARKESIRRHEQEIEIMELDSTPIPALAVQSATSITDVPKPAGLLQSALPATVGGEVPKGTESPLSKGQPSAKDDEQDGARNRLSSQPLDIAPALDPWYKNSLMRYIAMLYNEAGAAHVEEKHRIFTNFMIEEARLRGINPSLVSASASGYTPVLEYLQSAVAQKPKDSTLEKAEKKEQKESKGAKVDGSVVVQPVPEEQEDLQYSPGGRPIVARPTKSANASRSPSRGPKPASQVTKPTAQPERIPSPHPAADGDRRPSSGGKPAQPVYVPFRAGANANTGSKPPTPTSGANQIAPNAGAQPVYKSVYRPYTPASATFQAAAPVTAAAASTGTSKAVVPTSSTQPPKAFQTSAQATPLSAEKTPEEYKAKEQPEANRPSTPPTATPPPLVQSPEPVKRPSPVHPSSLEKLKSLLPNQDPNRKSSTILNPRLENLKTSLLLYPSDYTFVTTAFDKWKTKAASHRASAEAEARQRGVESQQRIDQLFNNKEIAYSDIALLEDSHKQQEAEIKSQMNEVEYESYLTDVFDPLYKRLQEEIGVVTGLLRDAETMAKEDGVAGRDMLMLSSNAADRDDDDTASADEVDLAEVLRLVVELHYKLEERQEQLSECIVKRDRRRRAIDEVSVAGADKLNQVEFRQRLDLVEKNAAVAKSEDCKERLQPLWQLVRSSTLRGSRENKALLEEITRESEAAGEQLADPKNQSLKNFIKSALKALAASSTSLANSFYAIDTALNLAEFNSAVARATFDNAARHVITRLADERGAEDARLKEEHEARLGEIQTALKAAEESIEKAFRGREGQAEHEKRQKAALEEAKRRNADVRSALAVQTPIEPMGRGRFL